MFRLSLIDGIHNIGPCHFHAGIAALNKLSVKQAKNASKNTAGSNNRSIHIARKSVTPLSIKSIENSILPKKKVAA